MTPRHKKIILSVIVVLVIITLAVWTVKRMQQSRMLSVASCRNFNEAKVIMGEKTIQVAVADSAEERHAGLSGCAEVPIDSGMWFVFPAKQNTAFWMKDMVMPIDIIWISDDKIVGLVENAPAPSPEAKPADLARYTAPQPVTAVLELPAGKSKEYGLQTGTALRLGN